MFFFFFPRCKKIYERGMTTFEKLFSGLRRHFPLNVQPTRPRTFLDWETVFEPRNTPTRDPHLHNY